MNLCRNIEEFGECKNNDCLFFHPKLVCVSGYNCKFKHKCTYKHSILDRVKWFKNSIITRKNEELKNLDQRIIDLNKTIYKYNQDLQQKNTCIEDLK